MKDTRNRNRKVYHHDYYLKNKTRINSYVRRNAHKYKLQKQRYRETHRMRNRVWMRNHYRAERLAVIAYLGGRCVNCGCDDVRCLEINHVKGGGAQERKNKDYHRLSKEILEGKRKDVNLLCRLCQGLDYLERKYGRLPFVVTYTRVQPLDS